MIAKKKWLLLISLLVISVLALAACQPAEPEVIEVEVTREVEVPGEEVVKEVVVEPTAAPVTRKGGWLDLVVYIEEPNAEAAVTRLDVGEMDVYAYTVSDAELFQTVQGMENIVYTFSYGSLSELTFNPTGPELESGFNPFGIREIREAMHYLMDRNYIVNEIYGGLAKPKWTALTTVFPDYAKVADVARKVEAKYAHNPEKAAEIITTAMEGAGAELVDGKWTFNGEPVTIIFLIRVEDERREIGDYVSNLLEELGFTVDRQYKTSAEASALWVRTDPNEGLWHLYTGGWISNYVNRDQANNFDFYFTQRGYPIPLWQAYVNTEEFDTLADELARNVFTSLEERRDMIARALELHMEEAQRIFLIDRSSFTPRRAGTEVTGDLAAGVAGSRMNPFTMRFTGREGGGMTVGMPSILDDPWNAVGGSNWVYDAAVQRACQDYGMMVDPFTGLRYPQRIEKAEVTVLEDLPVGRSDVSEDWLTLEKVSEIVVPEDAWADWDAENQVFITVGEKFPDGLTAKQKTVVYYPSELYDTTWHDGSPFDLSDIVMFIIMYFDWGKEASPIFDASMASQVEANLESFRGVRIVSEDPLVIESYTDSFALEAELIDQITNSTWYPSENHPYQYGTGAWHSIGVGWLADAAGELAFSSAKADELEIDWMNYIGGPSLEILNAKLAEAIDTGWIPYQPTMSAYITAEEAAARWANLQNWYQTRRHFWIGTGPYYLEGAFPLEGTVIARQNPNYIDLSDRWAGFTTPRIAEVELDGPGVVDIGSEAAYDVLVSFEGEAYPLDDIDFVSYLVFDATGEMVATGSAEAVEDGLFTVALDSDLTSGLAAGANKLEVVVVSKAVAIPTFEAFEFVTQ